VVRSRLYTGRVVTVSNARILDEPVYNYTREFPYLWEESSLPISYAADRARAEQILLDAAEHHTVAISSLSADALSELQRRYCMAPAEMSPAVFYQLTDNRLELTVPFIARERGIGELKAGLIRDILAALEAGGIDIASATIEIVGMPTLGLAAPHRELHRRATS
jgi:small-conductance mechanosensitive channel